MKCNSPPSPFHFIFLFKALKDNLNTDANCFLQGGAVGREGSEAGACGNLAGQWQPLQNCGTGVKPDLQPLQQPVCRAHSSRGSVPAQGWDSPSRFSFNPQVQYPIHLPHLHPNFISASPGQDRAGQHLLLAASLTRASFRTRSY